MASANFKMHPINHDQNSCLDHDPKYLQYLEQKAEEERMMRMLEKNLEPC
jgi:hypothetical protein